MKVNEPELIGTEDPINNSDNNNNENRHSNLREETEHELQYEKSHCHQSQPWM